VQADVAEPSQAGFSTPQHEQTENELLTPTSADESGAMRFRNLNEVYDETSEVELMDSDVEALLVETGEPANYNEAACHQEWVEAMDREMESIEKNKT